MIGRLLNLDAQKVSNVIWDMSRKWRLYDNVRGITLSKDRFQFIFKYEKDLRQVLETGVWTHEDWSIVVQRWEEKLQENFLQFMPIVHLRNIPMNHYMTETIR